MGTIECTEGKSGGLVW